MTRPEGGERHAGAITVRGRSKRGDELLVSRPISALMLPRISRRWAHHAVSVGPRHTRSTERIHRTIRPGRRGGAEIRTHPPTKVVKRESCESGMPQIGNRATRHVTRPTPPADLLTNRRHVHAAKANAISRAA